MAPPGVFRPWGRTNLRTKTMVIKSFPGTANISAIAIPLPDVSNLITSNLYAVGKSLITLIDTGLKSAGTFEFVQGKLAAAGFSLGDIERIIITHGHMDHFGLAASILEAVGHPIECFIHEEDKWQVSSGNHRAFGDVNRKTQS